MSNTPSESALRGRAARLGLRLRKVREGSRDYWQYGPYMLVRPEDNAVIARGMDLEGVAAELVRRTRE